MPTCHRSLLRLAIKRGALIAIDEINQRGGVLGRKLKLRITDHRGNPARGVDNVEDLVTDPDVLGVIGGVHTHVALRELPVIHRHGVPYLDPWAAGTTIVDNGYEPNFVFRLSVRDQYAGAFLVEQAIKQGYSRPALLLVQNPWGRSNHRAMTTALKAHSLPTGLVHWFNWGTDDLTAQLRSLQKARADVILLVGNPPEAAVLVNQLAAMPEAERLPVISHWGITGDDFPEMTGPALQKVNLSFLQTFSFFDPPDRKRADHVLDIYCRLFEICDATDIPASIGTAHAYDLVHIFSRAVELAGRADRARIRDALEQVGHYRGLTRHWERPFTPERHEALDQASFRLGYFDNEGTIRPIAGY